MIIAKYVRTSATILAVTTALLGATAPAHAIPITGAFTGTVDSGIDLSGFFGTAGGDLSGLALSGTFGYDTDLAPAPIAPGQFMSSGALNWLDASITLNGTSYLFNTLAADPATNHDLLVGVTDDPDLDSFSLNLTRTQFTDPIMEELLSFFVLEGLTDFTTGLGLPQSLSWTADDLSLSQGYFSVSCQSLLDPCSSPAFSAAFSLSRVSASPKSVTPVPEPGTLGLLGIGLAGLLLRLRTRRTNTDISSR